MPEPIEFENPDGLAAGAVGEPGAREFLIQARAGGAQLTVLVEKEQVAILSREALAFLDRLDADHPVPVDAPVLGVPDAAVREPTVPLFRAQVIGLGYDPARQRVIIELRELSEDDDDEDDDRAQLESEGFVARVYATRHQVEVMARAGADAVTRGRPDCPLCGQPMGPDRHICPRLN